MELKTHSRTHARMYNNNNNGGSVDDDEDDVDHNNNETTKHFTRMKQFTSNSD